MEPTHSAALPLPSRDLAIVTAARFIQNVAYRIIYPLMPFLGAQLGISVRQASYLITMQVAVSLFSPLGGFLSAKVGQRTVMVLGMLLFALGTAVCAIAPGFGLFLLGYALIGFSTTLYHPAAQSYLSMRTPYARRGWALGIYEVSWAAAALLGVAPLMYLVGRIGHPGPAFALMALGGVLAVAGVWRGLPPAHPATAPEGFSWRVVGLPSVFALLLMFLLIIAGTDLVFVVQSVWLNAQFGADPVVVGLVAALQGVSELVGSFGSAFLVDRIGKRRSVVLGYGLVAVSALLLPLSSGNWLLFLPVIFCFTLGFEFGIVSSFPLASGVAPAMRSTVLSLCTLAVGIGRTVSSLAAEPLWQHFGIGANTGLAAVSVALGVALCMGWVREHEHS